MPPEDRDASNSNEMDENGEEEDEGKENDEPKEEAATDGQQEGGKNTGEGGEWRPMAQDDQAPSGSRKPNNPNTNDIPNPWKNPGDVSKKWERRLNVVEDGDEKADETADEEDKKEAERVDMDDAMKDANFQGGGDEGFQTLGAAPENDDAPQPVLSAEDQEEEDKNAETSKTRSESEDGEAPQKFGDEEQDGESASNLKAKKAMRDAADASADDPEKEQEADEVSEDTAEALAKSAKRDLIVTNAEDALAQKSLTVADVSIDADVEMDTVERGTFSQDGVGAWQTLVAGTSGLSQRLCEQLRLLLEPMIATKLRGDYRTGKRINMRKVIPYIASQFRKDKIWLRRTKPVKRQYQVVLAIDDTSSMVGSDGIVTGTKGELALSALATISRAMTQLEVGDLGIVRFGAECDVVHPLDKPFTDAAGADCVSSFSFSQRSTNLELTMSRILSIMLNARRTMGGSRRGVQVQFQQLVFLVSDGQFHSDSRKSPQKAHSHSAQK